MSAAFKTLVLALGIGSGGLAVSGCAFFSAKAPAVEACAPTPAKLAEQVADILIAGGDYVAALEQAALADGEQAVICAVKAFMSTHRAAGEANERAAHYLELKGAR